jgi:hypothetical protein
MLISRICLHNKFRAGLWEYRLKTQYMTRLPVPHAPPPGRQLVISLAQQITELARARYHLHRKTRDQIQNTIGAGGTELNQKLTAWWDLDFSAMRSEMEKVAKRELTPAQRSTWEARFATTRKEHERLTGEIVALEVELSDRVYRLFDLTPDEIKIIEETTRYRYGEV